MNRPAKPVAQASFIVTSSLGPKAELVRYTENTNVVMTVANGCVPQSQNAQDRTLPFEAFVDDRAPPVWGAGVMSGTAELLTRAP